MTVDEERLKYGSEMVVKYVRTIFDTIGAEVIHRISLTIVKMANSFFN